MERRRDYRHRLRYPVSFKLRCRERVLDGLESLDVSASGLRFRARSDHGLADGDRVEVQLVARVKGRSDEDALVMATDAVVVRTGGREGAIRFENPLAY